MAGHIDDVEELGARVDLAGALAERSQQAEFDRGQVEAVAMPSRLHARFVELQRGTGRGVLPVDGATQQGTYAGGDFGRMERFADVVVSAEVESAQAIGLVGTRGDHDQRHPAEAADFLADAETVRARQHQVEQDHGRRLLADPGHDPFAGVEDRRQEALVAHDIVEQVGKHRLVLDDQAMAFTVGGCFGRGRHRAPSMVSPRIGCIMTPCADP